MKKIIFILIMLCPLLAICQFQPGHNEYKSLFVPLPTNTMQQQLQNKQNLYDQNLEYLNNILSWILDLESQTTDSTFITNLEKYYKTGKDMYGTDVSTEKETLDLLVLAVKEEIVAYNKRIATK